MAVPGTRDFSWTLAMEDLETVLPGGVQVTTLEPMRDKDGHITLHLRVLGPRDFVKSILEYAATNKSQIRRVLAEADTATIAAGAAPRSEERVALPNGASPGCIPSAESNSRTVSRVPGLDHHW